MIYLLFPTPGPKLFKEPSAKSNKPIIHNAISHCCLAGKVNEPQKNQILEVSSHAESDQLMRCMSSGPPVLTKFPE